MPEQPARRRTQQERTAESTRRLLESAIDLFARNGYEATTAAEIALHAGYSRAMVNARFGTKEALLDELLRTQYEERILSPEPSEQTGVAAVLETLDRFLRLAEEHPGALRAMLVLNFEAAGNTRTLRPRIADWVQRFETHLITTITDGQVAGTISPDVDPVSLTREVLHTTIGAAYTWIVLPEDHDLTVDLRRLRERVIGACAIERQGAEQEHDRL